MRLGFQLPPPIRPGEQIAERPPFQDDDPGLSAMLLPVMDQVTTLAQRFEIVVRVVG